MSWGSLYAHHQEMKGRYYWGNCFAIIIGCYAIVLLSRVGPVHLLLLHLADRLTLPFVAANNPPVLRYYHVLLRRRSRI